MGRLLPIIKLLLIVIVGLFIIKFFTKFAVQKFPNKVTQAVDNVVQSV